MSEVMTQIMEGNILNQFPFLFSRLLLKSPEPLMQTAFRQTFMALREEDIGTDRLTSLLRQVVKQWLTHIVYQVNLSLFASLEPDRHPSDLGADVSILNLEMGHITDTAPCPIT